MLRRLIRDEQGVALVLALIAMLVLGGLSASILTATAVNHRSAKVSADANHAFSLAENGLAYAEGRLYSAPTSAEGVLVPGTSFTPDGDTGMVAYHGTLCDGTTTPSCSPKVWTLYGVGTYNGVTRTVSAKATIPTVTTVTPVTSTTTTTATASVPDSTIWNYIYVNSPSGCTSISGSVTINVPLYTQGGLCINGNVKYTGSDLEVAGALSVTGNAAIGSSAARISKLNVAGSCTPAPCDGSHAPIWVNVPGVGHTLTPVLTMPTVNLPNEYASVNPGPAAGHACQAGSNVPANFFDNNTTLNLSDGSINLFPSGQPYDCKVGSNELKWDGTSKLTVNGAFYFDGNFSFTGNQQIVYSGKGTLFFTGTISQSGTTQLCGIAACAGTWDTATNVLVLVAGCWANSTGSSLVTTNCVSLSGSAKLQAGIYTSSGYTVSGTALNMGPVLAQTASLTGNVSQMLPIHNLPVDAPLNSTTTTSTTTATTTTMVTTTSDGSPQAPSSWNG